MVYKQPFQSLYLLVAVLSYTLSAWALPTNELSKFDSSKVSIKRADIIEGVNFEGTAETQEQTDPPPGSWLNEERPPGTSSNHPKVPYNPIKGRQCFMGLYDYMDRDPNISENWEGQPLGTNAAEKEFYNNRCMNTHCLTIKVAGCDLLSNSITSFIVTGWCECEFFDNPNCDGHLFSAYNREDGAIFKHGDDDNRIESFRCWETNYLDKFIPCRVMFSNGGEQYSYLNVDDGVMDTPFVDVIIRKGDLEPNGGVTDCRKIEPGEIKLRSYKINGCSCEWFRGDKCEGDPIYGAGSSGMEKLFEVGAGWGEAVGSYKCYTPYGIPWVARDDMDEPYTKEV
ncbi:hypothetical protein H072_7659 [Dactylellina haptotyla CBS 200.50]|uniref:EGF-like domain-containing protein n=1 Tax=Dactylellina haptotyla (strain CBS 200.50) TaxID=1284197 RepID=S8A6T0_DACHA|nr:hypothetical protein H072_7659 [Dactylellina haptotyla CBS 200.50]